MTFSNIEPLARQIAERICRRSEAARPSSPPMTEEQVAAWVDAHWECAAADLEAGLLGDDGAPVLGANWELGLAAYRERARNSKQLSS
jgi:precorrin-2 methylase